MRRKIFSCFIIFVFVLMSFQMLYASTNTFDRTEDDLKIWNNINVTSTVKRAVLSTPKVDEKEKIYDFADLFTDEEEEILYSKVMDFVNDYKMDMVIVTIDDNNKVSARDYADDFYDYNYFGINSTHDGLLLLIDMDNRKVWISTTGNAILVFDDRRINNILDYVQEDLISAKYNLAANDFVKHSSKYAKLGVANSNADMKIDANGNYVKNRDITFSRVFNIIKQVIIFPTIITIIILIIGYFSHRNVKKAVFAKAYLKNGSMKINIKQDNFVTTSTTRTRIVSDTSSGGSSTHRGSSGTSHGGGGRSF